MGKMQRDKGTRFERATVQKANEHGLYAVRVPLSGAAEGFKDDVIVTDAASDKWNLECKKRSRGFKQLYDWIEGSDGLVISADRSESLVVLNADDFFDLLKRVSP